MLQEAKRQQEHDFKWNVGENSDWLTEQNPNPKIDYFYWVETRCRLVYLSVSLKGKANAQAKSTLT